MSEAEDRRRRADAFLATGEEYHRLRPGYPDDVVDWMLPAGPVDVLDLGAGTGRLTDSLVVRGLAVVAVDPSDSMLSVLVGRHPGVPCLSGAAEAIPMPDASVDAIVVGQAWHWMDPVATSAEAALVLRPGGTLAMVWNQRDLKSPWETAFHAVQYGEGTKVGLEYVDQPDEADAGAPFGPREVFTTAWSRTVAAADHLALYTTHSPFLVADADEQRRRLSAWEAMLAESGVAEVTQTYRTVGWRFRLAP